MKKFNSSKNINNSKLLTNVELFSNLEQNQNVAKLLINEIGQMNRDFKLKHCLSNDKFSSDELIMDALKTGQHLKNVKNSDNLKRRKRNEIIKEIEGKAITKYITNKSEKNKKNLNEEFQEILDKYNDKIRIKLDKYFDDLINAKNEQTKIIIENQYLESKIESSNDEYQILKQKLFKKNEKINKIIKELDEFNKLKPFFELIRKFPNEEPMEIMSVFFNNKQYIIDQLHRLDNANIDYDEIEKSRNREKIKENNFRENIIEKINEQKEAFNYKMKLLDFDIKNHEGLYDFMTKINAEKIKYKTYLLHLYNIIKNYIPEKNYNSFIKQIGYDPINSSEEFDPSIFSHQFYVKLIHDCIISRVSKSNEGKLLRNTIMLGNYLARKYLDKNENEDYRYNPVKTFKKIKLFFDSINVKNYSLKAKLEFLQDKLEGLISEKKNLENIYNKKKIKFNKFIEELETLKLQQKNTQKINENYNNIEFNEKNHLFKEKAKTKRLSNKKSIEIEDNNNGEQNLENINKLNNTDKNTFFITDINKLFKRNKLIIKKSLSNENYETTKNNNLNNNTVSSRFKSKKYLYNKNIIFKLKKFLNLKKYQLNLSKNKDKIHKINGVKLGNDLYPNIDNLIKQLAKQDHFDIFNIKRQKRKLKIENDENFPLKNTFINKKNNIMKKNNTQLFYRPFSSGANNYQMISHQILTNIDNIINSMKNIGKDSLSN